MAATELNSAVSLIILRTLYVYYVAIQFLEPH
jgi:hypothetical protein